MGDQPSIYLACAFAALAQILVSGGSAHAQVTDRQVMIGGGITPISINHTTATFDDSSEQSVTQVQSGLGGDVLLAVGFGLGSWVLAAEASFLYSAAFLDEDDLDITTSASRNNTITQTEVLFGPSARFLFTEGNLRPFIEAGAGVGVAVSEGNGARSEDLKLYVRGGPGLQIRLTDTVSLDLGLRAGYASTSVELRPDDPSLDGFSIAAVEYTVQRIDVDVAARVSIWL